MTVPQPQGWVPLKLLRNRFQANVAALQTRYPTLAAELSALAPKEPYAIRPEGNRIHLAAGEPLRTLQSTIPPEAAHQIAQKMFANGKCDESALIAGEDLGWLWNALYQLPCNKTIAPGHRPPLYFLIRDLERLWVILHVQDWQTLLADPRVRLYAGESAFESFRAALVDDVMCPWPRLSVTPDPTTWPPGCSLDTVITEARNRQTLDLVKTLEQLQKIGAATSPRQLVHRLRTGQPLRVMGITSRYTTFLQYSMRDWLAGLEELGHTTQLFIEAFDHHVPNNLAISKACANFKPDLIIAIDHTRPGLFGVLDTTPVVMWVQDRLPHIYKKETGTTQGPLDFVIGYGRQELTQRFGYPASRFMPAMVGINPQRFSPKPLSDLEKQKYSCDVSFVSHATTPADQIIKSEIEKSETTDGKKLLDYLYRQLRGIYDSGGFVSCGDVLEQMIDTALIERGLRCNRDAMVDLFTHRVNNSLFRHQAVRWAAAEGVNLHLYGNGWDKHPEFARYARGVADNQDQLSIIYQASAINLQVTPFGAVHQRLLDGIAAGGFFLLRSVTSDELELILQQMHSWCQSRNIRTGSEMFNRQDAELQNLTRRYAEIGGIDPLTRPDYFFGALDECALSGFTRTPNTLWNNSEQVTFSTREQLQSKIRHYLKSPAERIEIAASMRQRILETHTYASISRRMLKFIADDLAKIQPALPLAKAA